MRLVLIVITVLNILFFSLGCNYQVESKKTEEVLRNDSTFILELSDSLNKYFFKYELEDTALNFSNNDPNLMNCLRSSNQLSVDRFTSDVLLDEFNIVVFKNLLDFNERRYPQNSKVVISKYALVEKFGERTKADLIEQVHQIVDEEGKIIKVNKYSRDGRLLTEMFIAYNSENLVSEIKSTFPRYIRLNYNSKGEVVNYVINTKRNSTEPTKDFLEMKEYKFTYDSNSRIKQIVGYNSFMRGHTTYIKDRYDFSYTDKDSFIEVSITGSKDLRNNFGLRSNHMRINKQGDIFFIDFEGRIGDNIGSPISFWNYEYDQENKVISKEFHLGHYGSRIEPGKCSYIFEYEYIKK